MERFSKETLRLLKEIEEATKEILEEAEKELRSMSPKQRLEVFGTVDLPFDDSDLDDLFPLGSGEEEEEDEF